MKYIKITNKANNVNRLKLEKLGFSTKRNDDSTIGQFGSGIKFAPISAIRKGVPFIFAGSDEKGAYTLEYVIRDEEGIPSIFYKYGDYEKPSSFTADAGSLSWESDFQIYREVVANAIDEAKLNNTEWTSSVVDVEEIFPVQGEFSVYLGATKELLEIHNSFDCYFSINRQTVYEKNSSLGSVKLYDPINEEMRVYCKGMLVYSSSSRSARYGGETIQALFDYEFDNLALNEERTVSSEYHMNNSIMTTLSSIKDPVLIGTAMKLFIEDSDNHDIYYETSAIPAYMYNSVSKNSAWVDVFNEMYGKSVIIQEEAFTINRMETAKAYGYDLVQIDHEGVYNFLTNIGLPTLSSVFGNEFLYEYSMGFSQYPKIVAAANMLSGIYGNLFDEIIDSIGVFTDHEVDGSGTIISGMNLSIKVDDETKKLILLNKDAIDKLSVEDVVSTIVHEWDHYSTGIDDGNFEGRMFRELADKRIGQLISQLWNQKQFTELLEKRK